MRKLGLKAIAIYRDGVKRTQPLPRESQARNRNPLRRRCRLWSAPSDAICPMSARASPMSSASRARGLYHRWHARGRHAGRNLSDMAKEGSVILRPMDASRPPSRWRSSMACHRRAGGKIPYTRFQPSASPTTRRSCGDLDRGLHLPLAGAEVPEPSAASGPTAGRGNADRARRRHALEAIGLEGAKTELTVCHTAGRRPRTGIENRETGAGCAPCPNCGMIMVRSGACHQCLNCGTSFDADNCLFPSRPLMIGAGDLCPPFSFRVELEPCKASGCGERLDQWVQCAKCKKISSNPTLSRRCVSAPRVGTITAFALASASHSP